jgi:hypothetical protein
VLDLLRDETRLSALSQGALRTADHRSWDQTVQAWAELLA